MNPRGCEFKHSASMCSYFWRFFGWLIGDLWLCKTICVISMTWRIKPSDDFNLFFIQAGHQGVLMIPLLLWTQVVFWVNFINRLKVTFLSYKKNRSRDLFCLDHELLLLLRELRTLTLSCKSSLRESTPASFLVLFVFTSSFPVSQVSPCLLTYFNSDLVFQIQSDYPQSGK